MSIRIVTYNIHKCIGGVDRRYDLARVVGVISHYQPDLVLLQEVVRYSRESTGVLQIGVIGDTVVLLHRFPHSEEVIPEGATGLCIFLTYISDFQESSVDCS